MSRQDDAASATPDDDPDHPLEIPPKGWKDIFWRVKASLEVDHVGLIAAGCAFYGLLAIFPAITAAMAIGGLVTEPAALAGRIESLVALMPRDAAQIVIDQAVEVAGSAEGGLGLAAVIGVIIALWSASKGAASLIEGLNVAYGVDEDRGFVRLTLARLTLTLGVMLAFFLAVAALVALPVALSVLPFGGLAEGAMALIRWPILAAMVTFGLAAIYRWAPSRPPPRWRWVTPGAILATILWIAGSIAFSLYVTHFGSYNETFGTLGGAIVLLTWLWLSAFIVLLGAELDAEIEAEADVPGAPEPTPVEAG